MNDITYFNKKKNIGGGIKNVFNILQYLTFTFD